MGGRGVLSPARKHACAPEGKSGRAKRRRTLLFFKGVFLRIIVKNFKQLLKIN